MAKPVWWNRCPASCSATLRKRGVQPCRRNRQAQARTPIGVPLDRRSSLGDQMRSHFRPEDSNPAKEQADGAAFDDFRNSVTQALSNLQATINDPSVDEAAKKASDSLVEALKTELDSSWNPTSDS